jgi:hypothetical protein
MREPGRITRKTLFTTAVTAGLFAATPAHAAPIERVIHISVDGLGGIALKALVENSPATYPNFVRLRNEGALTFNARTDFAYTETVPDHVSILTGRPVSQPAGQASTVHHGTTANAPASTATTHTANPNVPYVASAFDVAHDAGLSTSFFTSKNRMGDYIDRSYNATHGAPDVTGPDNGRDKIDVYVNNNTSTPTLTSAFLTDLTANNRRYAFLHLVDPDTAGHATGWGNAAWNNAVKTVDTDLGVVLDYVNDNAAVAGRTMIVLTADHGGTGTDHTDAANPANHVVPFILWGPGVEGGTDLYSLAANRVDPGNTRPDYNAANPPIRNGDSSNLALSFLNLGPIPGSFMNMTLVPEPTTATLLAAATLGLLTRRRGPTRD